MLPQPGEIHKPEVYDFYLLGFTEFDYFFWTHLILLLKKE